MGIIYVRSGVSHSFLLLDSRHFVLLVDLANIGQTLAGGIGVETLALGYNMFVGLPLHSLVSLILLFLRAASQKKLQVCAI